MLDAEGKVVLLEDLAGWREALRKAGRCLVVTNGCFDLLHAGHVRYLERARRLGDALLVGLNGDASVRALKGVGRPVYGAADRALVLGALACVDAVCEFPEMRAVRFLEIARPDQYVKGGDYSLETLDKEEREVVERYGGRVVILPFLPGKSTTATIEKIVSERNKGAEG